MVSFIQSTPIHYKLPASMLRAGLKGGYGQQVSKMIEVLPDDEKKVALNEIQWQLTGKPYFEVYPKVIEGLKKTNLNVRPSDIPMSILHELNHLCIKFPNGLMQYTHMLMTVTPPHYDGIPEIYLVASAGKVYSEAWATDNEPFCELIGSEDIPGDIKDAADYNAVMKIALGVMFLASDPEYIKPIVLKRDEGKPNLDECVERAKRRGVYGFTIGESIERCPHFRRPHFAIRWTGKGATIPKLVPVKGAVIGKEIITTVPTGFEPTDIDQNP
jgi:hypothetical protein